MAYWGCRKEEVEGEETQVCTRTTLQVGFSRSIGCHPRKSPELISHARRHRRRPRPPVTEAAGNSMGSEFQMLSERRMVLSSEIQACHVMLDSGLKALGLTGGNGNQGSSFVREFMDQDRNDN